MEYDIALNYHTEPITKRYKKKLKNISVLHGKFTIYGIYRMFFPSIKITLLLHQVFIFGSLTEWTQHLYCLFDKLLAQSELWNQQYNTFDLWRLLKKTIIFARKKDKKRICIRPFESNVTIFLSHMKKFPKREKKTKIRRFFFCWNCTRNNVKYHTVIVCVCVCVSF